MKKITILLTLFLVSVGLGVSQTVSSVSDLSNSAVYTLKTNRDSDAGATEKGYLMYHTDCPDNVASNYGSGYSDYVFSESDEAFHWAIYKSSRTGNYYFYSVKGQKFIASSTDGDSKPVALSETPLNEVEIRTSSDASVTAGYPFLFSTNKWALNTAQTTGAHGVVSWGGGYNQNGDRGNVYKITKVGDLTEDMQAAIETAVTAYETVTYPATKDNLSNSAIYTLKTNRNAEVNQQGYLMYHTDCPDNVASNYGSGYPNYAFSKTDQAFHWAIYKSAKTQKYYFYSIKGQKFIASSTDGDSKPVALSATPLNDVEIRMSTTAGDGYPFLFSTNQWALNTANISGAHGVVSWSGGYNVKNDGGNVYKIMKVGELSEETLSAIESAVTTFEAGVNVTYIYKIGEREYTQVTVEQPKNGASSAPAVPFVTVDGYDIENIGSSATATVNVTCTENLPFQVSSDENNLVWQAVEPHWNQAAYKWQYDADDVIVSTPEVANNSTEGYSDAQLWAFTGNLIDGFKIQNKAAGTGKWLRKNGGEAQVSATDDNNLWLLAPTTAYDDKATNCCFHLEGDNNYINHNGGLKFYGQADNGSTNRFYAPAYPLNEYAKDYIQAPAQEGVVGQLRDLEELQAIQAAYSKTSVNAYDMAGVQELKNALAAADFTDVNAFDVNKYYRLLNVSYAGEYMVGGTDTNVYGAERNQLTNLNSVFKFESTATDGQYYITVNGRYFGKLTTSQTLQLVSADGVRGEYSVVALDGTPKYVFQDKTNTANPGQAYLHHANHGTNNNIVGWGTGAAASQWYLVEAKSVKVGLHAVDGKSYSTVYLPFDVEATGNTKAYYAKEISGTGTEKTITMTGTPDNKVKALQGALLMNDAAEAEAVLSIVTDAAAPGANLLKGSCTAVTQTAGTVYVFGNGSDGVGFYRNNGDLKANRAYVDEAEGMMLVMKFDGQTTGIIDGVQTEGAGEAPLYDLSGRRVVKAGKGVYIRNGKKIYVK